MSVKLSVSEAPPLGGQLVYRKGDNAFDFQAAFTREIGAEVAAGQTTSLLFGTLQIEVAVRTRQLLYVWGYCPDARWRRRTLAVPVMRAGALHLLEGPVLTPGVSHGVGAELDWSVSVDDTTGWVCVDRTDGGVPEMVVQFAADTAAGLVGGVIQSVWLRPKYSREASTTE